MATEPVIIIGAPRSGTTWLGHTLSCAPCFTYCVEPRPVWEYGNWVRPDDVLTREDARPAVTRYIRRRFDRLVAESNGRRLLEKTPNNCFRIDFIDAVFPEAFYVFVTRDPRTQVSSLNEMKTKGPTARRLRERLLSTPPRELPSLLSRLPWLANKVLGRPSRSWGTRPPGWRDAITREDYAMLQWVASMHFATQSLARIERRRVMRWKYEEATQSPGPHIRELGERIEEDLSAAVAEAEAQRRPIRESRGAPVPTYVESMLARLGYGT